MNSIFAIWLAVAPVQSSWEAPAGCPGQTDIERQVELLMLEPETSLPYHGRIDVHEAGYRLQLQVGTTTRTVLADECARLGTAAALIIAVEHDPVATAAVVDTMMQSPTAPEAPVPTEPAPLDEVERPEPTPRLERAPDPPPPEPAEPPSSLHGVFRVGVGGEVAVLPPVGAAFLLAGGLAGKRWRVELGGTVSLPRDVVIAQGAGFRGGLFTAHALGCWVPSTGRLQAPLCGGLEVGGLSARGFGPGVVPRTRTQAWLAALASGGLEVWIWPRLGVMADAAVLVGLRKPAFHVDNIASGDAVRAGAVGARFVLGPTLRFP